jgi:hypothetical protein
VFEHVRVSVDPNPRRRDLELPEPPFHAVQHLADRLVRRVFDLDLALGRERDARAANSPTNSCTRLFAASMSSTATRTTITHLPKTKNVPGRLALAGCHVTDRILEGGSLPGTKFESPGFHAAN